MCLTDPTPTVCPAADVVDETVERPYLLIGLGIGAAITVVSAIEAYRRAKSRRAEAEAIFGPQDPTEETSRSSLRLELPTVSVNGDQYDFNIVRLRFR